MPKLTADDVTVTRLFPSGAWEVAAMVDGHRMARVYYDYTKLESVRLFLKEANRV